MQAPCRGLELALELPTDQPKALPRAGPRHTHGNERQRVGEGAGPGTFGPRHPTQSRLRGTYVSQYKSAYHG
eukprot:5949962-Pleurochrysis_carterae.AAC.1